MRGHLFQGRYKAVLVDGKRGSYFLTAAHYIHLNPVRGGMVGTLEEWEQHPWHSGNYLTGAQKGRPEWLGWERLFAGSGEPKWSVRTRREFRSLMAGLITRCVGKEGEPGEWKHLRRGWILGAEEYVEEMKEWIEGRMGKQKKGSWAGEAIRETEEALAEKTIMELLGNREMKDLGVEARLRLIQQVRQKCRARLSWLAERTGYSSGESLGSALSKYSKRCDY